MNQKKQNHTVHDELIRKMKEISEPGPQAFCELVKKEPGLLENYLQSCGIHCTEAELGRRKGECIYLSVRMEKSNHRTAFVLRFLQTSGTLLSACGG